MICQISISHTFSHTSIANLHRRHPTSLDSQNLPLRCPSASQVSEADDKKSTVTISVFFHVRRHVTPVYNSPVVKILLPNAARFQQASRRRYCPVHYETITGASVENETRQCLCGYNETTKSGSSNRMINWAACMKLK